MRLALVGLSHHTAPVELREKLALPAGEQPVLLAELRRQGLASEGVLVSTCNRVELLAAPAPGTAAAELAAWLAEYHGVRYRTAEPHLYVHEDEAALRHLFRVASSLDSMVIGEPQILGQVKDAYRLAVDARAAGMVMHKVMDRALHVAKRVLTETGIGREAVSVGRSGVELARQVLGTLENRAALLVGAGAHGKLVARSMLSHGLGELVVANRTFSRAADLAEMFGGTATHLDEIPHHLRHVDVVVTSTGAGRVLIDRKMIAPIMRRRRYRSLVMIDLSVPRNIAPEVNEVEGVFRFDVDDLRGVAKQGAERRLAAAEEAERLVAAAAREAWQALRGEDVHARIGGVVRLAEQVRRAELDRARAVLDRLDPRDRAAVEAMTRAVVKKLLHRPLSRARELAKAGAMTEAELLLAALGADEAPPPPPKRRKGDARPPTEAPAKAPSPPEEPHA